MRHPPGASLQLSQCLCQPTGECQIIKFPEYTAVFIPKAVHRRFRRISHRPKDAVEQTKCKVDLSTAVVASGFQPDVEPWLPARRKKTLAVVDLPISQRHVEAEQPKGS